MPENFKRGANSSLGYMMYLRLRCNFCRRPDQQQAVLGNEKHSEHSSFISFRFTGIYEALGTTLASCCIPLHVRSKTYGYCDVAVQPRCRFLGVTDSRPADAAAIVAANVSSAGWLAVNCSPETNSVMPSKDSLCNRVKMAAVDSAFSSYIIGFCA